MSKLTPTETRIFELLRNGARHNRRDVLVAAFPEDGLASYSNLHPHISALRKKLGLSGHELICELYRNSYYYRIIRPISTSD